MSRPDERDSLPPGLARDFDVATQPDDGAVARVRETTLASFRATADFGAGRTAEPADAGVHAAGPPGGEPRPARGPWWTPLLRPALSGGLAAAMVVASVGIVAANSGPGDAFYGLRLAAEELNLPFLSSGDGTNRALGRLQQRLDEAQKESGDPAAVSAALKAYRDELRRALAEATDESTRQRILAALGVHETVLDTLSTTVPAAADSGVQQARDQVGQAQQNLRSALPPVPSPALAASPSPAPTQERTVRPTETRRPTVR